ncbi:hypothetical protein ACI2JN_11655 [Ochrobactrum teleogrylli]|uniref:Uncharacterized protein n=1 Tax=Ochrobactrum teleogrylli TaxID=2479765 RepID=A0ABY2Y2H2_9HYPH|nr:hypothetical protein [[Ochrobactrum] teleogrylli]TNV11874.1 hypothetical protein FIC94_17900 [[Ochrobactrum] teleogrylli]
MKSASANIWSAMSILFWEDAERAALFDYLNNNPVRTLEQTADLFRDFLAYTDAIILAAQEAGSVRSGSPKFLASFARGATRHTLKRRRPNPLPLEPEERQLIIDMCWSALSGANKA